MGSTALLIFKMRALELGELQGKHEGWAHSSPTPGDTSRLGAWPLLLSCHVTLGKSIPSLNPVALSVGEKGLKGAPTGEILTETWSKEGCASEKINLPVPVTLCV